MRKILPIVAMVAIAATATAQQPEAVRTVPIQPAPIGESDSSSRFVLAGMTGALIVGRREHKDSQPAAPVQCADDA